MESNKSVSYLFSQLSDKSTSSTKHNTSSINSSTTQDTNPSILIPVPFIWKDKASTVYVTGTFCNWKQKFIMNKTNNEFVLLLKLQEGSYQYKFIVDGQWQYSKYHPTYNDNGMINNIIEAKVQKNNLEPVYHSKDDGTKKEQIKFHHIPSRCNEMYIKTNNNKGHIYLNHLLINEANIKGNNKSMHLSLIKRVRSKYVTIIYYKNKK